MQCNVLISTCPPPTFQQENIALIYGVYCFRAVIIGSTLSTRGEAPNAGLDHPRVKYY